MYCPECSRKIEPETILCPRCGVKGDFPPTSRPVCDLFLMGYSDPSLYEELTQFLLDQSFWDDQEDLFARLSDLPAPVTKGMDAERAHRLRLEIEKRGGIVERRERQMRDRGTAKKIIREGEEASASAEPAGVPSRGGRGYLFLFLISLVAVVYLAYYHDFSRERQTVQSAVRKIASRLPKAEPKSAPKSGQEASAISPGEEVALSNDLDPEGVRLNNEGVSLMDQGHYVEAVQSFQAALLVIPGDETITQNLYRAWLHQGYQELGNKDFESSIFFFQEALKVSDESPEVYKLLGMSALNLSDEVRAEEFFRSYLEQVPDDSEVARILGEMLYKQNRLEEGVGLLQVYLAINPGDSRVQDLVDKANREAVVEEGFDTHEGTNFDVRYDGIENMEAGYLVVQLLEDAYRSIGAELSYYPSDRVVTILYSEEDFQNVTQTPVWTRGLYDGKIRVPIGGLKDKSRALERVVFHEYTHALVHEMSGGRAPTWLNEGLAQYFEGEPADMHVRNAAAILGGQDFISFDRLEGSFLNLNADAAAVAYTQSYTVVDLIIEEHGIYAVQKLLTDLGEGKDLNSALQVSVGLDYPGLQEEWLRYLRQRYS